MELEFEYLADRQELVPLVIDWWRTVWLDHMGNDIVKARDDLSNSLSKTELPIHILAKQNGDPVGTAALKLQELPELFPDCQYWLGSVFVEEGARNSQVASLLSMHVVRMAKRLQLPHLYLQTLNMNGGLYAKLGWYPLTDFTYEGEQSLLMRREL